MFRAGLDPPKVSSFTGLSCHQKGYGLGKTVDTWYARAYFQRLLSRQNCYCFEELDRPDRLETALFGNRGTA